MFARSARVCSVRLVSHLDGRHQKHFVTTCTSREQFYILNVNMQIGITNLHVFICLKFHNCLNSLGDVYARHETEYQVHECIKYTPP